MPIYEFHCRRCQKKTTVLVLRAGTAGEVRCRHCGSADLEKLWSRFASPKSEEARLEALADPSAFGDVDENDPDSVARFMKRMGEATGEDLGGDVDTVMEEAMREGDESGGGDDE
jgi:putative FmdB family regulatory protein